VEAGDGQWRPTVLRWNRVAAQKRNRSPRLPAQPFGVALAAVGGVLVIKE
jgi:hypothetical protein